MLWIWNHSQLTFLLEVFYFPCHSVNSALTFIWGSTFLKNCKRRVCFSSNLDQGPFLFYSRGSLSLVHHYLEVQASGVLLDILVIPFLDLQFLNQNSCSSGFIRYLRRKSRFSLLLFSWIPIFMFVFSFPECSLFLTNDRCNVCLCVWECMCLNFLPAFLAVFSGMVDVWSMWKLSFLLYFFFPKLLIQTGSPF